MMRNNWTNNFDQPIYEDREYKVFKFLSTNTKLFYQNLEPLMLKKGSVSD